MNKVSFISMLCLCLALTLSSCSSQAQTIAPVMDIDTTFNLYVFKPHFSQVELEVGSMPSTDDESVIFCAAAAFTAALKDSFAHNNIVGAYVTHGQHYRQSYSLILTTIAPIG